MKRVGVITGSGLYRLEELVGGRAEKVSTRFGPAEVVLGELANVPVAMISRHGAGHRLLPNMINHRANLSALKELEVGAILATSVVGIVDASVGLARVVLFDDLHFPENRLSDGSLATVFTEEGESGRGHYMFEEPFSASLRKELFASAEELGIACLARGVYAHVNGPRFNSRTEISVLKKAGVTAVSQTCGPEAILAGELEIPYQLAGFGIDYANGVDGSPTPVEELNLNLEISAKVLPKLIAASVARIDLESLAFEGFVYRFEG